MTAKPKLNPRAMMEKAIEVMEHSVAEGRSDGKASPLVGAVLVKPDGSVDTASRGELREGDHAEFTLLERKHRDTRLDGSVIFATLEPCAPGARKHPKLACAERIVNARIADVWVGIEDPDPNVDGRGIRYLEEHGVRVHFFDRDLQERIRKANKAFLVQAQVRAAEAKKGTFQPAPISRWDEALSDAAWTDLAKNALERYRQSAGIPDKTNSVGFQRRLERQGLLRRHRSKLRPTGFGLLLFGKAPREMLHHAGLNGTLEFPEGAHEIRTFDGPAVLIPGEVEKWLRPKMPQVIDRSRMARQERSVLPFELIREAVINALVHRDYDLTGATCHVVVTADAVRIRSPGAPLSPVTLEQLQDFSAPMYNRNPKLQFAFGGTKLVEGRGLGMRTLAAAATQHGLPVPKYAFDGVYLNLTLYRHAQAAVQALGAAVLSKMSRSEREGWEWLVTREETTSADYAKAMNIPYRTAMHHLGRFQELNLLVKVGSARASKYKVRTV
ncbi:MAG: hypothetical protein AMXMBFR7_47360 [Planctomycetota bacterium]